MHSSSIFNRILFRFFLVALFFLDSRKLQDGRFLFSTIKSSFVFCSFIFFRCYLLQHRNSVNIKSISREHKLMMALERTSYIFYRRCDIVRLTWATIVTVHRLRILVGASVFFFLSFLSSGAQNIFLLNFIIFEQSIRSLTLSAAKVCVEWRRRIFSVQRALVEVDEKQKKNNSLLLMILTEQKIYIVQRL